MDTSPAAAPVDLAPVATHVADLVRGIGDEQLSDPTPCTGYTVAALLDHLDGLALAFTLAARKEPVPDPGPEGPIGHAERLTADWRTRIPERLADLARAWTDPAAWEGTTRVGGVDMDGQMAAMTTADEVVVHGWDLARATGQEYRPDPEAVTAALSFVELFSGPGTEGERGDAFGPERPVPEGATALERLVALTGRDPHWQG
ncbi:TIGR03086 family metal-binding protein [Ornithinicoccus halotolerans]|uniref:TIGR03086 family metal-binding protein n=1 Tax=Ornithinicoccus halotolerans TaxID=1748220 RepID=UPI0012960B33|nr:TIGR03086 family metal-binding protein [Ornithinicoccus halotolerans]